VAYVVVHDIACSWCEYERVGRDLLEPPPAGLLVHVAGPTEEGVRLVDIWAGEQLGVRDRSDRLVSAIGTVALRSVSRDFRPHQVLINRSTDQLGGNE
jgi:hypothetical protein